MVMVASKIVSTMGLSWADEVEKEEEEARSSSHPHQKPNPFGSARPREVVLEEKGVDWRRIDEKLHEPTNSRKEKQMKENVPAPTAPVWEKQPRLSTTRSLEGNVTGERKGASSGGLTVPQHSLQVIGPPLLYPPKNVLVAMKDIHCSSYSQRAETKLPNHDEFERRRENMIRESSPRNYRHNDPRENHTEWERRTKLPMRHEFERQRENRIQEYSPHHHRHIDLHEYPTEWERETNLFNRDEFERHRENRIRKFSPHHYRHIDLHENHAEWERCNPMMESSRRSFTSEELRREVMGERHGGRAVRASSVHGEGEWENRNPCNRRDFFEEELVGPPRVNKSSLPHLERGHRAAEEDICCRNMENGSRRNVVSERRMGGSPVNKPPLGRRVDLPHKGKAFQGNHKGATVEPTVTEKLGCGTHGRQRFVKREFEGPSTATVDGRRYLKWDAERVGLTKDKKRGMQTESNNPHANQRRRR